MISYNCKQSSVEKTFAYYKSLKEYFKRILLHIISFIKTQTKIVKSEG